MLVALGGLILGVVLILLFSLLAMSRRSAGLAAELDDAQAALAAAQQAEEMYAAKQDIVRNVDGLDRDAVLERLREQDNLRD